MSEERRRSKRLELDGNIKLHRLDGQPSDSGDTVSIKIVDLSKMGLGFNCSEQLENKSIWDTEVVLWTKEVLQVVIRIVRVKEDGDQFFYGAEFLGMSEGDQARIDIYTKFDAARKGEI
ncbi:PilZ domain-containing protein [bacterium 1XD42-8]|jgi:hypothetical protein|nr:PilZ domain-containing protein [Lachnospiraceae bacterium]RKJ46272.1 PilZ domain-containing protein [bacterium 1XD42-8]